MKSTLAISIISLFFLLSCKSDKEKRIDTVFLLVDKLNNNEPIYIKNKLFVNKNTSAHSLETIINDCNDMNEIINRYGMPPISNLTYVIDSFDMVNEYNIDLVLFNGKDTFQAWYITSIILHVTFGPLEYNSTNKINNYRLEINTEGLINKDTILNEYKPFDDVKKLLEEVKSNSNLVE